MKKIVKYCLILTIAIIVGKDLKSQISSVEYQYDNNGCRYGTTIILIGKNTNATGKECISIAPKDMDEEATVFQNIKIYPNPTEGILKVEITYFSGNEKTEINANLFNNDGKHILNTVFISNTEIDISMLPNGIYILNLNTNKQKETIKIIKK